MHRIPGVDAVSERATCHMMEASVLPEAKEAHRMQWHCI